MGAALTAALFIFLVAKNEKAILRPNFKAMETKKDRDFISDTEIDDEQFSQTTAKDLPPIVKFEIKDNIAEVMRLRSQGVNVNDFEDALQNLAKYGDTVFDVASEELLKGNDEVSSKENMEQRIALVDFLGSASQTNATARKVLREFSTSDLDYSKTERVVHMDLADRLEAFSYFARNSEADAVQFVKSLTGNGLKREYIYTMFIGYKMAGMEQDKAMEKLYEKFK